MRGSPQLANFHPDVVLIPPGTGSSLLGFDPIYRGRDGVRRYLEQWKSGFAQHRYEVREIADAGRGRFAGGTIGDAGIEVHEEYGNVNTIEGAS